MQKGPGGMLLIYAIASLPAGTLLVRGGVYSDREKCSALCRIMSQKFCASCFVKNITYKKIKKMLKKYLHFLKKVIII